MTNNPIKPLIKFEKVGKWFADGERRSWALKDVDFEVFPKEFFILVGPSGSGKSTILRILSGLETPSSGRVVFSGRARPKIAFVFQNFALFPWLTVFENVEFGLKMEGVPAEERRRRVAAQIEMIGLEKFENYYPRELSGGMKQRVGIARALAVNPQIILMDEPFSELDSFTAKNLRKELLNIWQRRDLTVVMVSHLIEEAVELGDRLAVLTPQPASVEKIIRNGLPRPRDRRAPEFFKIEDETEAILKF
ncbi:MAG: ABC transporter ATP-binding protein [Parcubacteria group bacterium]|nr:ABC transporter ATP-binding protein [Parcubacteria group bacterium]